MSPSGPRGAGILPQRCSLSFQNAAKEMLLKDTQPRRKSVEIIAEIVAMADIANLGFATTPDTSDRANKTTTRAAMLAPTIVAFRAEIHDRLLLLGLNSA